MKVSKSITILLIVAFPLMLSQSACKSKKKRAVRDSKEISKDNFARFFESKNTDWEAFSSKMKIEVKDGKSSSSVNASLRMYRDSLVWISASVMGIEAGRILVTQDSFFVMEKFSRKVSMGSIEGLSAMTGTSVSISQLQNLILGGLIYPAQQYRFLQEDNETFLLKTRTDSAEISQKFFAKNAEPIETILRSFNSLNKAHITYRNFQATNKMPVPGNLEIIAQSEPGSGFNMSSVNLDLQGPEFPISLTFPFSIPPSYERVFY